MFTSLTDAHLKNWGVIYPDKINPKLAPAYDIISTLEYLPNNELALNFAKTKNFYAIDKSTLSKFAERTKIEEAFILTIVNKVIELANEKWPSLFKELPLTSETRAALKQHWKKLKSPFQIRSLSELL